MSVPNQKIIQIARRTKRDKDNLFATTNLEALQQAMNLLKGSGLKMWLYLNKNQENYRFELSRQACADWGIKKDSYYDGIRNLIDNGYLRPTHTGSNVYYFYENALTENPTFDESEFYLTDYTKGSSANQNAAYGIQNRYTEIPERNNIYNTGILQNNTSSEYRKREERKSKYSDLGF